MSIQPDELARFEQFRQYANDAQQIDLIASTWSQRYRYRFDFRTNTLARVYRKAPHRVARQEWYVPYPLNRALQLGGGRLEVIIPKHLKMDKGL